jgi:thiol-disulfide isomerase/thioredoxin
MKQFSWLVLILCAFLAHVAAAESKTPSARLITPAQLKADLLGRRGHVVVLHFWATWCEPCMIELPLLAGLAREASKRGIDFLPVSLDDATERNAALVGRILAAKTGSPTWSPILKMENTEDLFAMLDPQWQGEIPVFFSFDRAGRPGHSLVGNLEPGDFERLVGDLVAPAKK